MISLLELMNIHIFAKMFSQQLKKIYCINNDSKNTNGFISKKTKEAASKVTPLFYCQISKIPFLNIQKPPINMGGELN
jgi:hypothetical protein